MVTATTYRSHDDAEEKIWKPLPDIKRSIPARSNSVVRVIVVRIMLVMLLVVLSRRRTGKLVT